MDALTKLIVNIVGFCVFLALVYSWSPGFFWILLIVLISFFSWLFGGTKGDSVNNKHMTTNNNTEDDFQQKLDNGEIRTYDDVVYHNGKYYENENSEEWEDFEYQYEEEHRR